VKISKDVNGVDVGVAEFAYDALGRRIEKKDLVDPNNTRRYYYNYNLPPLVSGGGWQVLCEYDGSDAYKLWYSYGNYIDEVLIMGISHSYILAKFYIHDHLYSPAALTWWNGMVIERYEYDAYGNSTIMDASYNPRSESLYGNPYLFTGRRVDTLDSGSLKIQYNRNRYYDYYTGRWLTHDPLGITPSPQQPNIFNAISQYEDAVNLYEALVSNPSTNFDPFGLEVGPFPWDPPLFECQINMLTGRRHPPPCEHCMCEWVMTWCNTMVYPVAGKIRTNCNGEHYIDHDIEGEYCESMFSSTYTFICNEHIDVTDDGETGCVRNIMVRKSIKVRMMTYTCTHENKWHKTWEASKPVVYNLTTEKRFEKRLVCGWEI
jgi:RHS repeat-associated protein